MKCIFSLSEFINPFGNKNNYAHVHDTLFIFSQVKSVLNYPMNNRSFNKYDHQDFYLQSISDADIVYDISCSIIFLRMNNMR